MNLRAMGADRVALLASALCVLSLPLTAHAAGAGALPVFGVRKIFFLLFLMLGPIKILLPFVGMTKDTDAVFRRRLAGRAILFSGAALAIAGLIGRGMLENFNIPAPVLALTGGVVLFLVALQTVLHQFSPDPSPRNPAGSEPGLHLAFNPLAFPTIVTPYGIAAVIVFVTLAQDDVSLKLTVAGVTAAILILDWIAMLYAHAILKWMGTALQVFAVVLGITQVALGLNVILQSLNMIGVLNTPVN
jgi:multiple antibiotic resistance protein